MDDEKQRVILIPDNYGSGINIAGFHFRPRFLIESIFFSIFMTIGVKALMKFLGFVKLEQLLGVCTITATGCLILGINGINGESLTQYIGSVTRFNRNKRTAYYNNRVKKEAIPLYKQKSDEIEVKLRGKDRWIDKFIAKTNEEAKKRSQQSIEEEQKDKFDRTKMFFIDDIQAINYIQQRDDLRKEKEKSDAKKKHSKHSKE